MFFIPFIIFFYYKYAIPCFHSLKILCNLINVHNKNIIDQRHVIYVESVI